MKLTKVVNIYPSMPITGVNPPIRTTVKRVTKSIDEIRTCLMARATIEEILSDGTTVRLNIGNYDKFIDGPCAHGEDCTCPECNKSEDSAPSADEVKSAWQRAYEQALEGKDLSAMTRKQRRAADAAARAAADAAVAPKAEVETPAPVAEEEVVESEVEPEQVEAEEVVEEEPVVEVEEVVETADIEELVSDAE